LLLFLLGLKEHHLSELFIITTNIPIISLHLVFKLLNCSSVIYLQAKENCNQVWVSLASLSESVSFATNDFSYFLLPQASLIFAETEREDLQIWSVSEKRSSFGRFFENS
jgi:hypothetical protein